MAIKRSQASATLPKTFISRIVIGVGVIIVIVFALTMYWRSLPKRMIIRSNEPLIQVNSLLEQKRSCEFAGGKWTDCGNPCQGMPGEICITQCEPQCLCGGDLLYGCPLKTTCSQLIKVDGQKYPVGICRDSSLPRRPIVDLTTPKVIPTSMQLTVVTTSYPYIIQGYATGSHDLIRWSAWSQGRELGQGSMKPKSTMSERLFIPQYVTSSVIVRFQYGDAKQEIELTLPNEMMTKTIYKKDIASDDCNDLVSETLKMPMTIYPYEARMRAALGSALQSFTIENGIATIELPPKEIFSSLCGYDQLVAIAQQITKETSAITQLIIR